MVVIDEFLGQVTFRYSDGRTMILEDEALNKWLQAILYNQQARNILESISAQQQAEAQQTQEPKGEDGPKIIQLADVIKERNTPPKEDLAD